MNGTDQFIKRVCEVSAGEMNRSLKSQAKRCILDYIGVTLAGSKLLKKRTGIYLNSLKNEGGCSTVIGLDLKVPLTTSALINGIHSHAIELDDGHRKGMVHVGAPVFSGLIPVAEHFRINGDNLLRGIISGYEATVRLAEMLQPYHKEKGYHTTGTCGVIGSAVAIAVAMGFDEKAIKSCISAGVAASSGFLKMQEDESDLKNYNVGNAAVGAVNAAMIANAGFCGPDDPLGGNRGFVYLMGNRQSVSFPDKERLPLEAIWEVYVKTHASCRHCHSPIDGVLEIKERYGIDSEDVSNITVRTYKNAIIGHDHKEVESINSAKLSMPFAIAVAMIYGEVGINAFNDDRIRDSKIRKLIDCIRIEEEPEYTNLSPDRRVAEILITMENGRQYIHRVDFAKGEPENPLSDGEIEDKFYQLSTYSGKTDREIQKMMDIIRNIENTVEEFYNML